jgi:hypothetical protein
MLILLGLFVRNRRGVGQCSVTRAECGAGGKLPEKLAIRKCFLVCCEGVGAIINI